MERLAEWCQNLYEVVSFQNRKTYSKNVVLKEKIPANFEPCGLKFHNPTDFKLQKHFGPIVHWTSRLVYLQIVMSYHQKNLGVAKGFQNNFQTLKLILNPEGGNFTTN